MTSCGMTRTCRDMTLNLCDVTLNIAVSRRRACCVTTDVILSKVGATPPRRSVLFYRLPSRAGTKYDVILTKTERLFMTNLVLQCVALDAGRTKELISSDDDLCSIHTADADGTKLFCRVGVGGVNTPVGSRDPVYNFLTSDDIMTPLFKKL